MATELRVRSRELGKLSFGWILGGGVLAGLVGGLFMALFTMTLSQAGGEGFWMPLRLVAATFVGDEALMASSRGVVVLGGLSHLIVSICFGVIFSLVLSRQMPLASSIAVGLFFAMAVWLLMTYVALPALNATLHARALAMPGIWFIAHLFYGVGVGLVPLFRRRPRRTAPVTPRTAVP